MPASHYVVTSVILVGMDSALPRIIRNLSFACYTFTTIPILVRAVGLLPTHILRVPQMFNYTMLAFGATNDILFGHSVCQRGSTWRTPRRQSCQSPNFGATARLCSEDSTLARLRVTITPQSQGHTIGGIGMSAMFARGQALTAPLILFT